jgi:hypothetical protein
VVTWRQKRRNSRKTGIDRPGRADQGRRKRFGGKSPGAGSRGPPSERGACPPGRPRPSRCRGMASRAMVPARALARAGHPRGGPGNKTGARPLPPESHLRGKRTHNSRAGFRSAEPGIWQKKRASSGQLRARRPGFVQKNFDLRPTHWSHPLPRRERRSRSGIQRSSLVACPRRCERTPAISFTLRAKATIRSSLTRSEGPLTQRAATVSPRWSNTGAAAQA